MCLILEVGDVGERSYLIDHLVQRALPTEARDWKGDFDGMLQRRHIRVLVPYSRTLFYNDKGRERGITAECARAFEQYLNKKYAAQLGKRRAAWTDRARRVRRRRRAEYARGVVPRRRPGTPHDRGADRLQVGGPRDRRSCGSDAGRRGRRRSALMFAGEVVSG